MSKSRGMWPVSFDHRVSGQVFFASAAIFVDAFDIEEAEGMAVLIDVSHAHFWDVTAVAALDKVVDRVKSHSIAAKALGMNEGSATLINDLNGSSGPAGSISRQPDPGDGRKTRSPGGTRSTGFLPRASIGPRSVLPMSIRS